jgi:hypothetical protein
MIARYGKNKVIIPGENIHKFIPKESSQNISKCPPKLVKTTLFKNTKVPQKKCRIFHFFFYLAFLCLQRTYDGPNQTCPDSVV